MTDEDTEVQRGQVTCHTATAGHEAMICALLVWGPGTQCCNLRCLPQLSGWPQEDYWLSSLPEWAPGIHSIPPSWLGSRLAAAALLGAKHRTLLKAALPIKPSLNLHLLDLKLRMK